MLAYDNRQRIIADQYRSFVSPGLSSVLPTFLVDGFVRGIWKIERTTSGAKLIIQPFEPLPAHVSQTLRAEGERLLHWVADKANTLEVEFVDYDGKRGKQNMWGSL